MTGTPYEIEHDVAARVAAWERRTGLIYPDWARQRLLGPSSEGIDRLDVSVNPDGSATITADSATAATLAGREGFGDLTAVQVLLEHRIADAWHDAGCPRIGGS